MPWFRVDDTLHSHPKTRRAGLAAMGLWSVAGSYCMAYKTNGFVPEWFVTDRRARREAQRLVDAGKWHADERDGEKGWSFHDWDDWQMTSEEIEAERDAARERQRRYREKRRKARLEAVGNEEATG